MSRQAPKESFLCPYCGSENSLFIDFSAGSYQEFISDCEICCRPVVIAVELDGIDVINISARSDTE